jgi:hypothetical protein
MLTQVRNYIKNQEEHHRKMNFEEEMLFFEKQIFSLNPVNPSVGFANPTLGLTGLNIY